MRTLVGFSFTESVIEELTYYGFKFIKNETTISKGYYQYLYLLEPNEEKIAALEIREIIDEVLYFSDSANKNFSPFINEFDAGPLNLPQFVEHTNTVYKIKSILTDRMTDGSLQLFLQLRKVHPLWAVELECRDFQKFIEIVKPERYFDWHNKKAILIHLGTSCCDLLITQETSK